MITLQKIIESQSGLSKLIDSKLPIKISYKVSKMINKIQPEVRVYEETRQRLVRELGQEDTETKTISVKPENLEKFQNELKKLLEVEVDLTFGLTKEIEKISIQDLDISIEPKELLALDWLLTE